MSQITLPSEPTPPDLTLQHSFILLYGETKIGKSTLCASLGKPLFLDLEDGLRALNVCRLPAHSWDDIRDVTNQLAKGEHDFTTLVIDTIDIMWNHITHFVCKQHNSQDIEDIGKWAKGYREAADILLQYLLKLQTLPYGCIMVSHAAYTEYTSPGGITSTKTVPTLPTSALKVILRVVDSILYAQTSVATIDGQLKHTRELVTHSNPSCLAGSRLQHLLPRTIALNPKALTQAFTAAFQKLTTPQNNSQTTNNAKETK